MKSIFGILLAQLYEDTCRFKNSTKINAVKELIASYKAFAGADVEGVDVQVETFGHPRTLDEVVAGAVDRAKQAFTSGDYGFGIEGGMFAVPQTKTGYMKLLFARFGMARRCVGMSPAYEWQSRWPTASWIRVWMAAKRLKPQD